MAQKKQKRMTPYTSDPKIRNQNYLRDYYKAVDRFHGVRGPIVETDMGPEQQWKVVPDREQGLMNMLDGMWNMIFDLHDRLDRIEKEKQK